ncbi:hypothetical protein BMS3Abin03_00022 [bacterium BMS3Abin03]|nr:hypothetical protein BMS3Abin03_00022 [bacterium BMS3Abin03]
MRDLLAEQLLARIMDWKPEEIFDERPLLQALADYKYNEYQQFSPGIRFIESLAVWLEQFGTIEEKITAYNFIRNKLIFISSEQLAYLVDIAFSDKINPILIKKSAEELNKSPYLVRTIINHPIYKKNLRQSLFIALSDGSRIDQLRRTSGLNNEQVYGTYDISAGRVSDFLKELNKDYPNCKYNTIFLIDDFTGSGKSYFRFNESKGKILKFLDSIFNKHSLYKLFDIKKLEIHVLFFIATRHALDTITDGFEQYKENLRLNFLFTVEAIQILDDSIKQEVLQDLKFINLIEKYFDNSIVDVHYKKGKYDRPYLGFDECALPLILHHNTPNNSLPIIWFPDDKKYKGLFPRISRHKE